MKKRNVFSKSVIAESFYAQVWWWWCLSRPAFDPELMVLFINDNKIDTFSAVSRVWLQDMKAVVEHDPLSERQIKREFKRMEVTFSWREALHIEAKRCSSSRVKTVFLYCWCEERSGLCHLVDKHWTYCVGNKIKTIWSHSFAMQLLHKLFPLFIPHPQYLYLDIESIISQLNFDRRVWCLLVTLSNSTGSSPTQCKVP